MRPNEGIPCFDEIERILASAGFECWGSCAASDLVTHEEVRAMCATDRCRSYNRNWACPPACGSVARFQKTLAGFKACVVFQTVTVLEDDFDIETMTEAEVHHKQRTLNMRRALLLQGYAKDTMMLSAGTCTLCDPCAFPDPCRHPAQKLVSMEAAGLIVTEACEAARIPYNHGPRTIAYSSCLLMR